MVSLKINILDLINSDYSEPSKYEIERTTLKKNTKVVIDIIENKISKKLISKHKLKKEFHNILIEEEVKIRSFLQKIYISNIDQEPELSSLIYHLLCKVKFEESKFYIIKILPRCHDELSFLICLKYSMIDNRKINKELPIYDNENIFEEFISPHFSYLVVDILNELKEVHKVNFLGFHQTSMFEYLSFSYINGVLKIDDNFLSLFFDFYTHFQDNNRHVLTTSLLMSDFKLSKKCFELYFEKLKDILDQTGGKFPSSDDD